MLVWIEKRYCLLRKLLCFSSTNVAVIYSVSDTMVKEQFEKGREHKNKACK